MLRMDSEILREDNYNILFVGTHYYSFHTLRQIFPKTLSI